MRSSLDSKLTTILSRFLVCIIGLALFCQTTMVTHAASLSYKSVPSTSTLAPSCGGWNVVPSPNVGAGQNQLLGVTALSVKNAWAVGDYTNNSGYDQTLTEHWDGTSWNIVPSPNVGTGYNYLEAVAAISGKNIWAVGIYPYNYYYQPLIEQWNGTSWNIVSSPIIGDDGSILDAITRVPGTSKLWAVGDEVNANGIAQTLTEYWNGTSWNVIPSPNVGSYANYLQGVVALSSKNIWAVGSYENSVNGPIQTLIEQWNGTSWNVIPSPNPGAGGSSLKGIARINGTNQLIAVGEYANYFYGISQTLIEQWNGTSWNVVSSPNVGSNYNSLVGVAATSANNIWAVGSDNNSNYIAQTLIEQWDGTTWNVVSSPDPGMNNNLLQSVARVPQTNQVWAVGYDNNISNGPYQTLIESYC